MATNSESDDERDLPNGIQTTNIPPTIYIIQFHTNTRRDAIEWLLEKIEGKQRHGGAELFVRAEPQLPGEPVVIHVSATKIKLLEIAESLELQKRSSNGLIQDFNVRDLDQFLYAGNSLDTILTSSEREYCVRHELEAMQAKTDDVHVPSYPEIKMFPGQSLLHIYMKEELITAFYPLHDRSILEDLETRWYKSLINGVTIDEIRDYFGESVAMYFGFMGFYTSLMVIPAALGVAHLFLPFDSLSEYAFFAVFNLVWVTIVLELWKRKCSELAYNWGTLRYSQTTTNRTNYSGFMRRNPVTGKFESWAPSWITMCKLIFISTPIIGLCILFALWLMVTAFWAEEHLIDYKKQYGSIVSLFLSFPTVIYAIVVWIFNYYYKKMSVYLTEWENHRTVEAHEWHFVAKLALFLLVNNFSCLFYIAFYIQDMNMLCSQLATMLIVTQMINHFRESLLPLVVKKAYQQVLSAVLAYFKMQPLTRKFFEVTVRAVHMGSSGNQMVPVLSLDSKDPRIFQAKEEKNLEKCLELFEDYMDIYVQFGYIFLFAAVYPMAAFWAVLSNILKLKSEAYKLCRIFQKSPTKRVAGIGAWKYALELLGVLSVMTNCGLLCISPRVRPMGTKATPGEWLMVFVALEHVAIGIKVFLSMCYTDTPEWVKEAMSKVVLQAKVTLRNERGKRTRRHLSRRFRSVHGVPRSGSRSRATTPVAVNGSIRNREFEY